MTTEEKSTKRSKMGRNPLDTKSKAAPKKKKATPKKTAAKKAEPKKTETIIGSPEVAPSFDLYQKCRSFGFSNEFRNRTSDTLKKGSAFFDGMRPQGSIVSFLKGSLEGIGNLDLDLPKLKERVLNEGMKIFYRK